MLMDSARYGILIGEAIQVFGVRVSTHGGGPEEAEEVGKSSGENGFGWVFWCLRDTFRKRLAFQFFFLRFHVFVHGF